MYPAKIKCQNIQIIITLLQLTIHIYLRKIMKKEFLFTVQTCGTQYPQYAQISLSFSARNPW